MANLLDEIRKTWDNPEKLRQIMDGEFEKNPPEVIDYTGSFPGVKQGKLKKIR
jgi:hypothetical protein